MSVLVVLISAMLLLLVQTPLAVTLVHAPRDRQAMEERAQVHNRHMQSTICFLHIST